MSWQTGPRGLNDDDQNFLKVYKVAVTSVRSLFYFLFTLACPKLPKQTLKEYLQSPPLSMTNADVKKCFNGIQRKTIADTSNPSGNRFDVTLLFVCIQHTCHNLAPLGSIWTTDSNPRELEYLLTCNKNFRNDLLHSYPTIDSTLMQQLVQELKDMIKDSYIAIGTRYKIDTTNEINILNVNVDNILKAPLPVPDVVQYQEELKILRDNIKIDFKDKGQKELEATSDNLTMTDPASFISRRETLKVTAIYTRIDLVEEWQGKKTNVPVSYEKLLRVLSLDGRIPNIVILEGPPGSGKTTLSKLVLAQWVNWLRKKLCSFFDLDTFDITLHYECSNSSISKYIDLLKFRLQETTYYLRDEDILRSARKLKILILVDAADELNPNSKKLLAELLETHIPESRGNLRLICTTRPQALQDLMSMIPKHLSVAHTKIIGIPPERREDFVEKLHDEMINEGQSTQETKGLINFLNRSQSRMGDHFRFPLMLTLLTYLWAADPIAVNGVTTVTTLYLAIHFLIQKRLHDRLSRHEKLKYTKNVSEIGESCCKFQKVLYHESLISLGLDAMVFPAKSTDKLRKSADQLELPQAEVFAAFLALERKWTAYGYSDQLSGSHKSLLEFYAALYVINVITGEIKTEQQVNLENRLATGSFKKNEKKKIHKALKESKTIRGILENTREDLSKPMEYRKYQNLFIHLIGLLAQQGTDELHNFLTELIDLMQESGVSGHQWFQVISEAKCDSDVAKYVAGKMKKRDRESWDISDSEMGAAIKILPTITPREIWLNLETDPSTLENLSPLCGILTNTRCRISLNDFYSFKNPSKSSSDAYLGKLNRDSSSCSVRCLFGNYQLPCGISNELDQLDALAVAIVDDTHATAWNITLTETVEALINKKLRSIYLHICKLVSPACLPHMIFDSVKNIDIKFKIVMSDVHDSDIDWAVEVITALWPLNSAIISICFPKSSLSIGGCEDLLQKLSSRSLSGSNALCKGDGKLTTTVSSQNITEEEADTLDIPGYRLILDPDHLMSWY